MTFLYYSLLYKRPYRSCAALGLFVLLSIVMTYPLICHPWYAIPGDLGDPLLTIWILGWNLHKILPLDFEGFWQANIFYPAPLVLTYSEHLFALTLLGLPVYLLSGSLILTYNFLFFASFILSGWGMYLLVKDLTGKESPALICGIIFAFFPFRFAHLSHIQVLTLQWVPFTFLYLNRFFLQPSYRHLFLFGLFYLLEVLSCGYYALFLTLFVGLFALYQFVVRRQLPCRDLCLKLLLLAFGVGVLAGPFFYPYIQVKQLLGFSRSLDDVIMLSADLTSYWHAPPGNRIWGEVTWKFHKPEGQLHPGLTTFLLALLGAVLSLKNKQVYVSQPQLNGFALLMAILAFVFSLGPQVHFWGRPLFPGPYLLLYKYVPGFDGLRVPARFGPFFVFALAVLAGYGITEITRRLKNFWIKRLFALSIGVLILIEYLSIPLPVPMVPGKGEALRVYQWLSRQPGSQPVMEIPIRWDVLGEVEYVYFSTFHWKDLLNGYSSYVPPSYLQAQLLLSHFPSSVALGFLEELGVHYVIVHLNKLEVEAKETLLAALPQFHDQLQKVQDFGEDQVYEVVRARILGREAAARRWISMPKIFSAEVLPSRAGKLVRDPLAEARLVRRAEKGEAGAVTFGPYLPLPSGRYQARFFLRVFLTEADAGAELGHLDVVTDAGTQQLALRDLGGVMFFKHPGYQMVPLNFEVQPADHQKKIECRVISSGKVAIAVERIEIWSDTADKSTEGG